MTETRRTFLIRLAAFTTAIGQAPAAKGAPGGLASVTPDDIHAAIRKAQEYFQQRLRSLNTGSPEVLLGPVMDETYYYRVGAEDQPHLPEIRNGWGMARDALAIFEKFLTENGVPSIIPEELRITQEVYFSALREAAPNRKLVVKHFPGGDPRLESTEIEHVHYDGRYPIRRWIGNFDKAITGPEKSFGVMLSHASYDLRLFPDIAGLEPVTSGAGSESSLSGLPPYLLEAMRQTVNVLYNTGLNEDAKEIDILSFVPASLNPIVTRYLREIKGYDGVLVGDWYNMHGVQEFCHVISAFIRKEIKIENFTHVDSVLLMTAYAGINYVRPLAISLMSNFWHQSQNEDHTGDTPEYASAIKDCLEKMSIIILDSYTKLKKEDDPELTLEDIKTLTFSEKFELIACTAQGMDYWELGKGLEYQQALTEGEKDQRFPALYQVINRNTQVVPNDLWQRGAIMVMVLRKAIVETVLAKEGINKIFDPPPRDANQELSWIKKMLDDPDFGRVYRRIDWDNIYNMLSRQEMSIHRMLTADNQ